MAMRAHRGGSQAHRGLDGGVGLHCGSCARAARRAAGRDPGLSGHGHWLATRPASLK
jgi:hypothetical protein